MSNEALLQNGTAALVGTWSNWDFNPSPEAKIAFENSLGKLIGVDYTLIASSEQVVSGINYSFICYAQDSTLSEQAYLVQAQVYVPISQNPVIKNIKKLNPVPNGLPGGWQNWKSPASPNAIDALKEATENFVGSNFKPYASTLQIVNGTNYAVLCEQTLTTNPSAVFASLVFIYQPLQAGPYITEIQHIEIN